MASAGGARRPDAAGQGAFEVGRGRQQHRSGTGSRGAATVRPSAAISASKPSTEAITASSHGVPPMRACDRRPGAARLAAVVAAARVVVADEVIGAELARNERGDAGDHGAVVRDRGRGRAPGPCLRRPAPTSTRTGSRPAVAGTSPVTVSVTAWSTRLRRPRACRATAGRAGGRRSCRRRRSSCAGPPSRRRRPPCGRSTRNAPAPTAWVSCAQVHHRLHRIDDRGEAALDGAAVDVDGSPPARRRRPRSGAGRRSRCGWSRSRSPPPRPPRR